MENAERRKRAERSICQNCKTYSRIKDGNRTEGSCYFGGKFVKFTSRKGTCDDFSSLNKSDLKKKYSIEDEKAKHNKEDKKEKDFNPYEDSEFLYEEKDLNKL